MGNSREVLRELPEEVQDEIGFALERVQRGTMPENAKPLKGIAPGVLERRLAQVVKWEAERG